jgi:two-component system OmpR family response regulator
MIGRVEGADPTPAAPAVMERSATVSTPPARVAVVEDELAQRSAIAGALRRAGYTVGVWPDGSDVERIAAFRPDLAILDVMLPGLDGLGLARALRERDDVPVMFVTAREAVADRLAGFALGADDYLVKPVVLEELLARAGAVLRRSGRLHQRVTGVGDLVIDEEATLATRAGQPLDLTATEYRLLLYLAQHRGRTLSKLVLLTQVWGYDAYDPNLVEVHVSALRRKLEAHGPRLIHTIRGLGYRLDPAPAVGAATP